MNPPEAAAKSDLHRVEERAEEGCEKAESARERAEELEGEVNELREQNEELMDLLGRVIGSIHRIDGHFDSIEDDISAWSNSYSTEPIAELFGLPEPNARIGVEDDDRDDGDDGEEIVPDDAEPNTFQIPAEDVDLPDAEEV